MKKETHKQKVKIARKMRTDRETRNKVNLFDSAEWNKRKEARIKKMKTTNSKEHKDGKVLESDKDTSKPILHKKYKKDN